MQGGAWIALLHQVPKTLHGNLVFTTTAGLEIAVQSVYRIDADYVLVRGRQTGVTECGGTFFIPYDRILFMGFQKPVKEAAVRAIYGEDHAMNNEPYEPTPEPEHALIEETPVPDPEPSPAPVATSPSPPPPAAEPPKPNVSNKVELLERLRARRSEAGPSTVKP